MSKRVLVVADHQLMPSVGRYVRYFVDTAPDGWPSRRPEVFADSYRCFQLRPPSEERLSDFDLRHYTAVYYWGLYDHILLQDTFRRAMETGDRLDPSPLCVAHHLLYARGQFAAARPGMLQPVILDPRLFAGTALARRQDPAQADTWLTGPLLQQDRVRLRLALDRAGFWRDLFSADEVERAGATQPSALRLPLPPGTFPEISEVVRDTINQGHLRLLWIDDNREWLEIPYRELGGSLPDEPPKPSAFWVLRAPAGSDGPVLEPVPSFEALARILADFSAARDPGMRVIVTDVLFGRGSKVSGLDILRHVRGGDLAASPRNVVMAFTGYGSPLLTAACHGLGADFVVQKSGLDEHGYTRDVPRSEPSTPPILEMFWNMLWLRAATWFTGERLGHLRHELFEGPALSALTSAEAKQVVDDVLHDINAVFPPHEWIWCFKRLRQQVLDTLTESSEYAYFWFDARGQESKELKRWRSRLSEQLNDLGSRFLSQGKPTARP